MTYIRRTYFTVSEAGISLIPEIAGNQGQPPFDPVLLKLANFLARKYNDNWITYTDTIITDCNPNVPDAVPDPKKINQWKNRLHDIIESTQDKYRKLIELYEQEENNLLNKIGSSTINKFNDTPQNANVGDTDEYTSTISKTETSVDPGEVINRLENIRLNYKNIYALWVREFDDLFGESVLI